VVGDQVRIRNIRIGLSEDPVITCHSFSTPQTPPLQYRWKRPSQRMMTGCRTCRQCRVASPGAAGSIPCPRNPCRPVWTVSWLWATLFSTRGSASRVTAQLEKRCIGIPEKQPANQRTSSYVYPIIHRVLGLYILCTYRSKRFQQGPC
jgi:hypothetical protein